MKIRGLGVYSNSFREALKGSLYSLELLRQARKMDRKLFTILYFLVLDTLKVMTPKLLDI